MPGAPTDLSVSKTFTAGTPDNIAVTLSWTPGAGNGAAVSNNQVRYRRKSGGNWQGDSYTAAAEWVRNFTANEANYGATLEFQVQSGNSVGWGAWSALYEVKVAMTPAAPAAPTLTAGNGQIGVSWTAPNNRGAAITGYEYVKKEGTNEFETTWTAISNSASLTSYTVTGLTNGTAYKFKLRAVNAIGDGAASSESDSVTPTNAITLVAESVTTTGATLTIGNYVGGWHYKKTAPSPAGSCSTEVAAGTSTATLSTLSVGTSYTWKAYPDSGCAVELATVTFPTLPGQVTGTPTVTARHESLAVGWTALSDQTVTGYKVQYKTSAQQWSSDRQVTVSGGSAASGTLTGLTNATAYTVRVLAYNASGDGAASGTAHRHAGGGHADGE